MLFPAPPMAGTSRAAILVTISARAVFSRAPMALQYTFTGSTSCHTVPSLLSWCSTCKGTAECDTRQNPGKGTREPGEHKWGETMQQSC